MKNARYKFLRGTVLSLAMVALVTTSLPAQAITFRDDVGDAAAQALGADPALNGVVQMFVVDSSGSIFFNCTGSMINPRTVLTAAHCINNQHSSSWGDPTNTYILIGHGADTFGSVIDFINGQPVGLNGAASLASDYIIHPEAELGFPYAFPGADIAMIATSDPLDFLPTYAMLFSPVTSGQHVIIAGYGRSGPGSTGGTGIDTKRRAGENMLGLVGSRADMMRNITQTSVNDFTFTGTFTLPNGDVVNPGFGIAGLEQINYYIDFDKPGADATDCNRATFLTPNDIDCASQPAGAIIDGTTSTVAFISDNINWFSDDDALDNEVGTDNGDSGSAIFFDQLVPNQYLIGGVLSGGEFYTSPLSNSDYGDVSYYTPLFHYYSWLAANNPYRYMGAAAGNGVWSDNSHWNELLDPNYYMIDPNTGAVVNGIPSAPSADLQGSAFNVPKSGTVFDSDINNIPTPPNIGPDGSGGDRVVTASTSTPPIFTNTPIFTALTNTDGDQFTGAAARYYDVTLSNVGTTTVDMNVEIDHLTINGAGAVLDVAAPHTFNSIIAIMQNNGELYANGALSTREYMLLGGILGGDGTITTQTVFNIMGGITGGANGGVGNLTINGDYVQSSAGTLIHDVGNGASEDLITVNGDVSLAGNLVFTPNQWLQFGRAGKVMDFTGTRVGDYGAMVDIPGVLFANMTYDDVTGEVLYSIDAASFSSLLGNGITPLQNSMADLLDTDRATNYANMTALFNEVDFLTGQALADALTSLAPLSGMNQPMITTLSQDILNSQLRTRMKLVGAGGGRGASFSGSLSGFGDMVGHNGMLGHTSFSNMADDTTGPDREMAEGWGMFGQVRYYDGKADADFASTEENVDGISLTFGLDRQLNENVTLGAYLSYADGSNDFKTNLSSADQNGFTLGLYGVANTPQGATFDGYIGLGNKSIDTSRSALNQTLVASTDADEFMFGMGLSRRVEMNSNASFIPRVAIDYHDVDIDAYTESGGSAALNVDGRSYSSLQMRFGGTFEVSPENQPKLNLELGGFGVYESDGDARDTTASFVSAPNTTTNLQGSEVDEFWTEFEAAASYQISETSTASLFLSQTLGRSDLEYASIGARLRLEF